jgi:hypothetical protein
MSDGDGARGTRPELNIVFSMDAIGVRPYTSATLCPVGLVVMRSLFLWLTLAFIAAFLGTGLLIWLESSRYFVSLGFWTLQMVMGSAVALAACIACAVARTPWLVTAAVLGWACPCSGYVFIALDQAKDASSHNLLGIQLVLYLGVGLLASLVGASIGILILLPFKART